MSIFSLVVGQCIALLYQLRHLQSIHLMYAAQGIDNPKPGNLNTVNPLLLNFELDLGVRLQ
jgi:hypothetical protein